ncbi:MAG: chemotaxis protein CheW [Gammaproteobacteria bacterium]|nr:chemotaxis protein CheW [Gammaproteobacteria bacterium]MDH4254384.1 chemotaxis protein CheW [Gammaproteobacteria bacterium]MDH5309317.1 chemotaxis protein CheW [Gammaproteobacteria bacterium]
MSASAEELYSLLVPLIEERLIVPRACVAEVIRFSKPERREGSGDWMLGTITWNGRELPIVAFEGAIGKDIPAVTGRTRVVVFYASGGKLKSGYFGVVTQGFPQLVRVNREVLKLHAAKAWPDDAPVLCQVKMINEYPLIPHLEKLESMIENELIQA